MGGGPVDQRDGALEEHRGAEQLLDDVVVQVAGDALAVAHEHDLLAVLAGPFELEGERRLGGEGLRHDEVRRAVAGGADLAHERERGVGLAAGDDRDAERGTVGHRGRDFDARALRPPVELQALSAREHLFDVGGVGRQQIADDRRGGAGARHHSQVPGVAQADHGDRGMEQARRPLADEVERLGEGSAGQQRQADLGRGGVLALEELLFGQQPAELVLGPLALADVAHDRGEARGARPPRP